MMRNSVLLTIIVASSILLTGCFGQKGLKDFDSSGPNVGEKLMPKAIVLAFGTLPDGATVDINAILDEADLDAQKIDNYLVWRKPLSAFNPHPTSHQFAADLYPDTVELVFALNKIGTFYFGASGPLPDVLSVVGTLYSGMARDCGVWDSFGCPTWRRIDGTDDEFSEPDNGIYEPKDIGLVGMGWKELLDLQSKGYLSGIPAYDSNFRNATSIRVKHKLDKPVWVIYYPVFVGGRDEWRDWGVGLPMNERWCQFASIFDNGTAMRSVRLKYHDAVASYTYCSVFNNNGEQSWVKLDGEEVLRQHNWGLQVKKIYNRYPESIELGGVKSWSTINPAVTITVVGDSVDVFEWTEDPSLGKHRNPPPDILVLKPNRWSVPENDLNGRKKSFSIRPIPYRDDPLRDALGIHEFAVKVEGLTEENESWIEIYADGVLQKKLPLFDFQGVREPATLYLFEMDLNEALMDIAKPVHRFIGLWREQSYRSYKDVPEDLYPGEKRSGITYHFVAHTFLVHEGTRVLYWATSQAYNDRPQGPSDSIENSIRNGYRVVVWKIR